MRIIKFTLKSMKHFFLAEKTITFFIIFGMMLCNIVFLFFGNIYFSDKKSIEHEINQRNRVTFEFINQPNLDNIIKDLTKYEQINDIIISTEDENFVKIAAYNPSVSHRLQIKAGNNFSNENIENGDNVFILNKISGNEFIIYSEIKVGEEYEFQASKLKCIGTIDSIEYDVLVPYIHLRNLI